MAFMPNRIIPTGLTDEVNRWGKDFVVKKYGGGFRRLLMDQSEEERNTLIMFLSDNSNHLKKVASHEYRIVCNNVLSAIANCGVGILSEFALCKYISDNDIKNITQIIIGMRTIELPDLHKTPQEVFHEMIHECGTVGSILSAESLIRGIIEKTPLCHQEKLSLLVKKEIEHFSDLYKLKPPVIIDMLQWKQEMQALLQNNELVEDTKKEFDEIVKDFVMRVKCNEFTDYLYKFLRIDLSMGIRKEVISLIEKTGILLFLPLGLYDIIDKNSLNAMKDYMLWSLNGFKRPNISLQKTAQKVKLSHPKLFFNQSRKCLPLRGKKESDKKP